MASARKSSTPASAAIAAAVSGLSPVIITVLMPIARRCANRSRMPPLTTSFRWMTPSGARVLGDDQRRAARRGRRVARWRAGRPGPRRRCCDDVAFDRVGRALADLAAVQVDAGHARLRRERHEHRLLRREVALPQAVPLLGQHDDRPALRRFVGERGELRRVRELAIGDARRAGGTRWPGGCRA